MTANLEEREPMKMTLQAAFAAAFVGAAGALLGQAAQAQTMLLIGNSTAGDTQASVNERFAELLNKYSNGRFKASVRHGQALGSNAQMLAALQAGSIHGMIFPAGFISTVVPEMSLFDMPFRGPRPRSRPLPPRARRQPR
jgi:TRAP-type C4-dicarboxylate transport system substrate-binding protein